MNEIILPWIECWDKLPKANEEVLVYGENGIMLAVASKNAGELVFWGTSGEVTHWCPLVSPGES